MKLAGNLHKKKKGLATSQGFKNASLVRGPAAYIYKDCVRLLLLSVCLYVYLSTAQPATQHRTAVIVIRGANGCRWCVVLLAPCSYTHTHTKTNGTETHTRTASLTGLLQTAGHLTRLPQTMSVSMARCPQGTSLSLYL